MQAGLRTQIYALFEDVDPLTPTLTPHLNAFLGDLHHPCAVLLEYLPRAEPLNCEYTRDGIQKAIQGIKSCTAHELCIMTRTRRMC